MPQVPHSLKTWFIIHFIIDYIFGVPLLFAPRFALTLFGFQAAELLTARLVGAALIGIGGISFFAREKNKDVYRPLLLLKILWSLSAIFGIVITLFEGAPPAAFIVLLIFAFFSGLWLYFWRRLGCRV